MPNLTQEQYDAEYDAEMERLNSEAAAQAATTTPPEPVEPAPEPEPKPTDTPAAPAPAVEEAPETPREKELRERLERTEKSLNDTKKWANDARVEAKRLRQEQEERDRLANRPAILDDNPGLEEAIRYAVPSAAPAAPAAQQQDDQHVETWAETVGTALPDLDNMLLTNAEFKVKAEAVAKRLGAEWANPIIAIRELTKLQVEQQRAEAQEQARKDFQLKGKKQAAMQVPGGGSGGNRAPAPVDEAERIRTMSSADFEAMRAKALGY